MEEALLVEQLKAFRETRKHITEALQTQQRLRWQQLRTAELTMLRLEEVQRDGIRGAEAREAMAVDQRASELRRLLVEEHGRLRVVLHARQIRSFEDKRRDLMDEEAVQRSALLDAEFGMWHDHLMQQFDLRRPLAQSDTAAVTQLLHQERRARMELGDLFTYERWNLADLEAMSRDDVADGVAPPRPAAPHLEQPPHACLSGILHWSNASSLNDFAVIAEGPAAAERPRASQPSKPPHSQPPDPKSWTFDDALAVPQNDVRDPIPVTGRVAPPPSRPPRAPPTPAPPAVAVAPPSAVDGALRAVEDEESGQRKSIAQAQLQRLAGIIQHNIETLPA
jgi:hypothetical protein